MAKDKFDKYYERYISNERTHISAVLSREYKSALSDFRYEIWDSFDAPLWATAPMLLATGLIVSSYNGPVSLLCILVLTAGALYTFFFGKGNNKEKEICSFFFYRFRYKQILIDHVELDRRIYLREHTSEECRKEANEFFDRCVIRIVNEHFNF